MALDTAMNASMVNLNKEHFRRHAKQIIAYKVSKWYRSHAVSVPPIPTRNNQTTASKKDLLQISIPRKIMHTLTCLHALEAFVHAESSVDVLWKTSVQAASMTLLL